jgi:hypothetical protein
MDALQEQHERAVGDAFVDWYKKQIGTSFVYSAHGTEKPDLVYTDGAKELPLEVTVAYYDAGHATMLWKNARDVPGAPDSWSSRRPDQKLVGSVNMAMAKKAAKDYPPGIVLVVAVNPDLTDAEEFARLLPAVRVPTNHSFVGIYVGGLFPASSGGSPGGYFWWKMPA